MQNTEEPSGARSLDARLPRRMDRWLVRGAFFVGLWASVWLLIKPRLIHDALGIYLPYPEFSLDGTCLRQAGSRVGGPVEYLAAFLSQGFYDGLIGALIVTVTAGLICRGTDRLIRGQGATRGWFVNLLPAFAVLILYQTYHHPLAALLALALCLWLAVACTSPTRKRGDELRRPSLARPAGVGVDTNKALAAVRPVAFLAICFGLYWLAGTVSVLFGCLVGLWYVGARRRVIAGVGAIVASALVPWLVGTQWFYMTIVEAYSVGWPFGLGSTSDLETGPLNVLRGLFLFPLAMLLAVALGRVLGRWFLVAELARSRTPELWRVRLRMFLSARWRGGRTLCVVSELALLAGAVAAVHQFVQAPHREKRFEMVHYTRNRQWDQVLRAARQVPPSSYDCFYRHLVNHALYHTGRLGDDLFSFSQDRAGLLLLTDDVPHGAPKFWMLAEIAWEMGDVNLAEQWAFETIEGVGECPSALEMLALICLAKDESRSAETRIHVERPSQAVQTASEGRPTSAGREAARVLLNRLKKNLIHGRRAGRLLSMLDRAPSAADNGLQQVERVRALRCTEDRVFQTYSEDLMLESLLQANPRNRMAFEYLMAFYLLTRRPDKLVQNLHRLDDFGWREIPRYYEEAILLYANNTAQQVPLHGRAIRPETLQRFQAFLDRFAPWQNQPQRAPGALADEFGDSYFYYYAFGTPGLGGSRRDRDSQAPLAGASGYGVTGAGGSR